MEILSVQALVRPGDIYQRSKLEGERASTAAIQGGQPVAIFRTCGKYGEGDLRFLKLFRSVAQRRFVMIGSGQCRLHMIHVGDLVDGIRFCGSRSEALAEVFILGDREFDIGKARRLLGFNRRVSVIEGIERMMRWYAARGLMTCWAFFGRVESLAY